MVSHVIARDCSQIRDSYQCLRDRLRDSDSDEEDIRREVWQLAKRLTEAVAWAGIAGLSDSPGLKRKSRDKAEAELRKRYQNQDD